MSLQGVLTDFGVADVFQLIAQQRKTGVLEIVNEDIRLEVVFSDGAVVRAAPARERPDEALAEFLLRTGSVSHPKLQEARRLQEQTLQPLAQVLDRDGVGAISANEVGRIARLLTHETIFELFRWDSGRFQFRPEEIRRGPGDELLGSEQVLLDALRMKDEWADIERSLPANDEMVLVPLLDIEEFQRRREEIEAEGALAFEDLNRVFSLADGRLTWRRVIDLSCLGSFAGGRALVQLIRLRVIRIERPETPAFEETDARRWARPALTTWVLGAAAFAVVGLLQSAFIRTAGDFPVPADAIVEARGSAALERLRVALEARRWAAGSYPATLETLTAEGGPLLAGLSLDDYSYEVTPGGYELHRVLP